MVEMPTCSAHACGRPADSGCSGVQWVCQLAQVLRCRSQEIAKGSDSAVSASVAAASGLLPKPSASSACRGSSPSSATLPGPAVSYSQVSAPLRAKSCQPSLLPTNPALARPQASCCCALTAARASPKGPCCAHNSLRPRCCTTAARLLAPVPPRCGASSA